MKLDDILALPTETHDLVQGTPAWDAFRTTHFGASEAAVMLGLSKKATRTELLKVKKTGIAREFTDFVQRILDNGHEVEAKARPIIEERVGEDLYPATCSRGVLSASCDGITLDNTFVFEHKQWNEELAASVRAGVLPDEHMPQCQQIMLVTGAHEVEFVVSDGTPEKMVSMLVNPDRAWWERIVAAWAQFAADLETFEPQPHAEKAAAAPIESLPAVSVRMDGALAVHSNLDVFGEKLREFIDRIPAKPTTDQEFADCDAACKALKRAEEALDGAEANALGQVQSVEALTRTIADLRNVARTARLASEKVVKARKDQIRVDEVQRGRRALDAHVAFLNDQIGAPYMPTIVADFGAAISGLKSLDSLRAKVDQLIADKKIEANDIAGRITMNLRTLKAHGEYEFLFADLKTIVTKQPEDFQALVQSRVLAHQAEEKRRAEAAAERERERIRAEEAARADREAQERLALERHQSEETAAPAARASEVKVYPPLTATQARVGSATAASNTAPDAQKVVPMAARGKPTLRLGDINSRIAPLAITEAGLQKLGFPAVARERGACLYHEADLPTIIDSMVAHLRMAQHEQVAA